VKVYPHRQVIGVECGVGYGSVGVSGFAAEGAPAAGAVDRADVGSVVVVAGALVAVVIVVSVGLALTAVPAGAVAVVVAAVGDGVAVVVVAAAGDVGRRRQGAEHGQQLQPMRGGVLTGRLWDLDRQLASFRDCTCSRVSRDSMAGAPAEVVADLPDPSSECEQVHPGKAPAGNRDFVLVRRPTARTRFQTHRLRAPPLYQQLNLNTIIDIGDGFI